MLVQLIQFKKNASNCRKLEYLILIYDLGYHSELRENLKWRTKSCIYHFALSDTQFPAVPCFDKNGGHQYILLIEKTSRSFNGFFSVVRLCAMFTT